MSFQIWLKEASVTRFEGVGPWPPRFPPLIRACWEYFQLNYNQVRGVANRGKGRVVRPPQATESRGVQTRCKINNRNKEQIIFAQQLLSC
jgi:hypothetical protein